VNILDKIYIQIIIVVLILLPCITCCIKPQKVKLVTDKENSIIENYLFLYDSIIINNYYDSIKFIKYSNAKPISTTLYKLDNAFYEIKDVYKMNIHLPELYLRTDTLITFSKSDTSNIFQNDMFIPIATMLQYSSMNYNITKENNMYKTFKRSLNDTTYTEIFYYDKNYIVSEFINTWQNNKIVYSRAK
jgi:hypothetical protein